MLLIEEQIIPQSPPCMGFSGIWCCFGFAVTAGAVVEPIIVLSPVLDAGYHPDRESALGFAGGVVVLMGDSLSLGRRLLGFCGNVISPRYRACRVKQLTKAGDRPRTLLQV